MLSMAAFNSTYQQDSLAFGILKQFMRPSIPTGYASVFGHPVTTYLPFATSIPLVNQHAVISEPNTATKALLEAISHTDKVSYAHTINHAAHVYNIAKWLTLSETEVNELYYAALLHDIGKLYYMNLVKTTGKLSLEQKHKLDEHSILSYLILRNCNFNDTICYAGLFHHYNQRTTYGYPNNNESLPQIIRQIAYSYSLEIPVEAKGLRIIVDDTIWKSINIITLTDAIDAAIDPNRSYKTAMPLEKLAQDFTNGPQNWSNLFNSDLKPAFSQYIGWLLTKTR
jgi:putative two-component system response regulator